MTFTIRELDASTWDAFAELVERNNGATVERFEQYGFARGRQVGMHAWIVSKTVAPELVSSHGSGQR